MNNFILLRKIISLIEDLMGEYSFPIVPDIAVEEDLNITGDDAVEFIIEYGNNTSVNN
jgi:hypothetical protein